MNPNVISAVIARHFGKKNQEGKERLSDTINFSPFSTTSIDCAQQNSRFGLVREHAACRRGFQKHSNEDRFVVCHSLLDYLESSCAAEIKSLITTDLNKTSVLQRTKCFVVIDGHGGSRCADFIKETLLVRVIEKYQEQWCIKDVPSSMCRILEGAFTSLEEDFTSQARTTRDISGACVVAALYFDGWLCVSNVGDAAAVLFDHRGTEIKMSRCHSNKNKKERARLLKAGGKVTNGYIENLIQPSRTIGDCHIKRKFPGLVISTPDSRMIQIQQGDGSFPPTLTLASDGLWDIGWSAHFFIKDHLRSWKNFSESDSSFEFNAAAEVIDYARLIGSADDITVVIIQFFQSTP